MGIMPAIDAAYSRSPPVQSGPSHAEHCCCSLAQSRAAAVTVRELRCGVGRGELDGGCEGTLPGRTTLSRPVTDVCDSDKWLVALTHVP